VGRASPQAGGWRMQFQNNPDSYRDATFAKKIFLPLAKIYCAGQHFSPVSKVLLLLALQISSTTKTSFLCHPEELSTTNKLQYAPCSGTQKTSAK
jgi:hypothetical protein